MQQRRQQEIFRSLTSPYQQKKVGIVTTGSEIKKGLIQDTFTPVLREKLSGFPTEVTGQVMPGDDKEEITKAILSFADAGADLIICTGGMSVDPDDRTPGGIRDTGAKIVTYGAPVLPGASCLWHILRGTEDPYRYLDFRAASCTQKERYLI